VDICLALALWVFLVIIDYVAGKESFRSRIFTERRTKARHYKNLMVKKVSNSSIIYFDYKMSLNINWSKIIDTICGNKDKKPVAIISNPDGTRVFTFPFCETTYDDEISKHAPQIPGDSVLLVNVVHQKVEDVTLITVVIILNRPCGNVCLTVCCELAEGVGEDMETIFELFFQMFEKSHDAGMCSSTPQTMQLLGLDIEHKIQKDVPDSIHVDHYIFLTIEDIIFIQNCGKKPAGRKLFKSFEEALEDARKTT